MRVLMNALLAIGASVMAVFMLGMLWYSPALFGRIWIKYMGKTEKQIQAEGGFAAAMVACLIGHICGMGILFYVVERFVIVHSLGEAIKLGLLLGALVFFSQVPHAAYNKEPIGLYLINHVYDYAVIVLGTIVMALITG